VHHVYAASTCCCLTCHQLDYPPDTLTVLMLHLQTSQGHCMRMLTALLVLHSSWSSVGCRIVIWATARGPALHCCCCRFISTLENCTIISCSIHCCLTCCSYCCGLYTPRSLGPANNCIHTLAYRVSGRTVPELTSLMVCHISTLRRHKCVCSNLPSTSAVV
jgi:hypothetical protein